MNRVLSIHAKELKNGYQYIATMEDGTTQIARRKATRLYPRAYVFKVPVNGGNKTGLALYVAFGQNPPNHCRDLPYTVYPIQLKG